MLALPIVNIDYDVVIDSSPFIHFHSVRLIIRLVKSRILSYALRQSHWNRVFTWYSLPTVLLNSLILKHSTLPLLIIVDNIMTIILKLLKTLISIRVLVSAAE